MAKQGGGGIYCAILIAKYNGGGGGFAIREGLNGKNNIDSCTILEYTNEYLVKAKEECTVSLRVE